MRYRRSSGQGQPGHHRQNRGKSNRGDETEEDVAADRVGQMDGRHVAAALDNPFQIPIRA